MSRSNGPRRRVTTSAQRTELLLFVEGLRTEELYLTDWARRHRDRVLVTIDPFRGAPLQLVQHAVKAQDDGHREAARGRGRPYDHIWCVFDVDEHPHLTKALDLARGHGINIAISNPCIELWFLLHFRDQTAYIDRAQAQRLVAQDLACGKVLTASAVGALSARYTEARDRAIALDRKHAGDGSGAVANPSTTIWRLIDMIVG